MEYRDDIHLSETTPPFVIGYRCLYCQRLNQWSETYGMYKDVLTHFRTSHEDSATNVPFEYNVVEYLACFYCEEIFGTYNELVNHHKRMHPDLQFAIVKRFNRDRCGLCSFRGSSRMIDHFSKRHRFLILKKTTRRQIQIGKSPIQFTNDDVEKLLKDEQNRKRKCSFCRIIFDTEQQYNEHSCGRLAGMNNSAWSDSTSAYYTCARCEMRVELDDLIDHFANHDYSFRCLVCAHVEMDVVELIQHDIIKHHFRDSPSFRNVQIRNRLTYDFSRVRVHFGNGLVLPISNLQTTEFANRGQLDQIIEDLMERIRRRLNLN